MNINPNSIDFPSKEKIIHYIHLSNELIYRKLTSIQMICEMSSAMNETFIYFILFEHHNVCELRCSIQESSRSMCGIKADLEPPIETRVVYCKPCNPATCLSFFLFNQKSSEGINKNSGTTKDVWVMKTRPLCYLPFLP